MNYAGCVLLLNKMFPNGVKADYKIGSIMRCGFCKTKIDTPFQSRRLCVSCYRAEQRFRAKTNYAQYPEARRTSRWKNYHLGGGKEYQRKYQRERYRMLMRINPEKMRALGRESARRYYAQNKDKCLIRWKNRDFKVRGAVGSFTSEEWNDRLFLFNYSCAYCGKHSTELHVEHMHPVSRGGTNCIENIIPACRSCNSSKRDRTAEEFCGTLVGVAK